MIFFDKDRINALLKWYRQEIGRDFAAAFVLDRDGQVIDYITKTSEEEIEVEFVDNIREIMGLILKKIAEDFTLGNFGAGTFDTTEYRFIFCEAGPKAIFVTLLDALSLVEPVFPYAYLTAEKITRIFEGQPISPVIPKIFSGKTDQKIYRKMDTIQRLNVPFSDYVYKLILGGDGAVGKTSMVQRFIEGIFRTDYKATIGTSITKKECQFDGLDSKIRFIIWDLAGQPQFNRIRHHYYEDADAGILVYDITRRDTFENIKKWYLEIKDKAKQNILMILVGNKTDLNKSRVVTTTEAENLAKELGLSYIETSAMTGENINDTFKMMALQLIKQFFKPIEISKIETKKLVPAIESRKMSKEIEEKIEKISELGKFKKTPITSVWKSVENDFNPWLEKNFDYLNEALDFQIIPLDKGTTTNFSVNCVLAEDKFNNKTIIYSQFGKISSTNLVDLFKAITFYNAKKAIWICEEILPEYEKIISWLNENSQIDISFYILKLEVFQVKDSPLTPILIKICGPSEELKKVRNLKIELDYIEKKRMEFWEKLIEKMYTFFPEYANISPQKTSWIFIPSVKKGLRYTYVINNNSAAIKLYFDYTDREINQKRFKEFETHKDEINKAFQNIYYELQNSLEWDYKENRNFQSITYRFDEAGLEDDMFWEQLQYKMVDAMKCLVETTKMHVENLKY